MADVASRPITNLLHLAELDDPAEKISISLTRSLLRKIDDVHHGRRFPSRSAAIAYLIESALKDRERQKQ